MSTRAKPFVWYELTTTETDAAQSFYRKVFGWDVHDSGLPGMKYLLLSAASVELGGMLSLDDVGCDPATPPFWLGYIESDDVDKDAARVRAAGGRVHKDPDDIPGIGRFAVVADPHGASFVLFRSAVTDQLPAAAPPYTNAHVGWRELHAGNGEEAFAFYSEMFGWTKAEAMDMGPLGIYQIYAINGEPAGGMMTKTPDMPAPMWLYYICVDDIDAAVARANDAGGKQLLDTSEVPGGMWISQFLDPQGAMFAMVGPRR